MHTYSLQLDSNDDGTWALDLTPLVTDARWHLGMAAPDDALAEVGIATLTLLDAPVTAAWLGRRLRIRVTVGMTTTTLFTALVQRLIPQPSDVAPTSVILIAHDSLGELQNSSARADSQVNTRTGAVAAALLRRTPLRRFGLSGRWLLRTQSILGSTTRFAAPYPLALEVGNTTLRYVGDDWNNLTRASTALADVASAEQGRFYARRDGTLTFLQRHTLLTRETPALTLDHALEFATFGAESAVNTVQVALNARRVGNAGSIIWQAAAPIACAPASQIALNIAWHDSDQQPFGAVDVLAPVRGVDVTLGIAPDAPEFAITQQVAVEVLAIHLRGATLHIRNPTAQTVYLLAGSVLRGTPIQRATAALVTRQDLARVHQQGIRTRTVSTGVLDDAAFADALARYILGTAGLAATSPQTLTLDAYTTPAALSISLFDRVRLIVDDGTHDVFITHEAHHLSQMGARHQIIWQVTPAARYRFWVLNLRALRNDTRVAL